MSEHETQKITFEKPRPLYTAHEIGPYCKIELSFVPPITSSQAERLDKCMKSIADVNRNGTVGSPPKEGADTPWIYSVSYPVPKAHAMAVKALFDKDGRFGVIGQDGDVVIPPSSDQQALAGPTQSIAAPQTLEELENYITAAIAGKLEKTIVTTRTPNERRPVS